MGKEVLQAHNQAALFDQSTLGKIRIEGKDCESFLQRVCTNRMNRSPGSVIYTPVLNETGTFETDLVALRPESDQIGFEGSCFIEHWCVDHTSGRTVHAVGTDTLKEGFAIFPLDPNFPEGGLVEESRLIVSL